MDSNVENKSIVIECDCGMHLLKVESDVEIIDGNRFYQEFYLGMFNYGQNTKPKFWRRLSFAWDYIRKGIMYRDQLCLTPDEAKKLAAFLTSNIVEGTYDELLAIAKKQ